MKTKRILALALASAMVMSMVACGGNGSSNNTGSDNTATADSSSGDTGSASTPSVIMPQKKLNQSWQHHGNG